MNTLFTMFFQSNTSKVHIRFRINLSNLNFFFLEYRWSDRVKWPFYCRIFNKLFFNPNFFSQQFQLKKKRININHLLLSFSKPPLNICNSLRKNLHVYIHLKISPTESYTLDTLYFCLFKPGKRIFVITITVWCTFFELNFLYQFLAGNTNRPNLLDL